MGRETRVTEYGWSAEFAIPFQSLRYGKGIYKTGGSTFSGIFLEMMKGRSGCL